MARAQDITEALQKVAGPRGYKVVQVSWEDCTRAFNNGQLSKIGPNITDVRITDREKVPIFTLRSENWNERLDLVDAQDVSVVVGNEEPTATKVLKSINLQTFLEQAGQFGTCAKVPPGTNLSSPLDSRISLRFQTVFLRDETHFTTNVYSYGSEDTNPQNIILYGTAQGTSIQLPGSKATNLFLYNAQPDGKVSCDWLKAAASTFAVGQTQTETEDTRTAALASGHATTQQLGPRRLGERCNVVLLLQLPVQHQKIAYRGMFGSTGQFTFGSTGQGTSSAARVSRGETEIEDWPGLPSQPNWTRHPTQHATLTVTLYYAVQNGVPSESDIAATITDLEQLYGSSGRLRDLTTSGITFME